MSLLPPWNFSVWNFRMDGDVEGMKEGVDWNVLPLPNGPGTSLRRSIGNVGYEWKFRGCKLKGIVGKEVEGNVASSWNVVGPLEMDIRMSFPPSFWPPRSLPPSCSLPVVG